MTLHRKILFLCHFVGFEHPETNGETKQITSKYVYRIMQAEINPAVRKDERPKEQKTEKFDFVLEVKIHECGNCH